LLQSNSSDRIDIHSVQFVNDMNLTVDVSLFFKKHQYLSIKKKKIIPYLAINMTHFIVKLNFCLLRHEDCYA
jgi:hypothetical protein